MWVTVPLVLGLLTTGLGLLVAGACRARLPGPLIPGVGLATLIVLAGLLTVHPATAPAAVRVCAAAGAAGVVWAALRSTRAQRRRAVLPGVLGAMAAAVAAVPVLLTGQGGVPGYYRLDDSATWLLTADHVLRSGREVPDAATSTADQVLLTWLGGGYPVGSFLPFGVAGRLAGADLSAAYGPALAATSAILALALAAVARDYLRRPALAAAAGLVGAQASLLVAYTAWGGVKEVTSAALVAVLAATSSHVHRDPRAVGAVGLAAGALVQVLGFGGLVWVAPALAAVGVLGALPKIAAETTVGQLWTALTGQLVRVGAVLAVTAVAAAPVLAATSFVAHARGGGVLVRQDELGNLVAPVPLLHAAGLWPTVDPLRPGGGRAVSVVALLVLLAAVGALVVAIAARRPAYPVYAGVALVGAVPAVVLGSPWVDAKALAIVSPVALVGAALLVLGLVTSPVVPARGAASVLAVALGTATACSWWQTGAGTTSAPVERFADLATAAGLAGAEGPVLVLDPEVYAGRWFLRGARAIGAGDLRPVPVVLRGGRDADVLTTLDVEAVRPAVLHGYRTLLRRTAPTASRPPAAFDLLAVVGQWEVWRRQAAGPPPVTVLPLSHGVDPAGLPQCEQVLALAATPGVRLLHAVPRDPLVVTPVDVEGAPPPWRVNGYVQPDGEGAMEVVVDVPRAGRWRVWVGGSAPGRLSVDVDGERIGVVAHELAHGAAWMPIGSAETSAGPAVVRLAYSERGRTGTSLRFPLGPVALTPDDAESRLPVVTVPVADARRLCDGRTYDWIATS